MGEYWPFVYNPSNKFTIEGGIQGSQFGINLDTWYLIWYLLFVKCIFAFTVCSNAVFGAPGHLTNFMLDGTVPSN